MSLGLRKQGVKSCQRHQSKDRRVEQSRKENEEWLAGLKGSEERKVGERRRGASGYMLPS